MGFSKLKFNFVVTKYSSSAPVQIGYDLLVHVLDPLKVGGQENMNVWNPKNMSGLKGIYCEYVDVVFLD